MTFFADLYFSVHPLYSYFRVGRYPTMMQEYDLEIRLKPVYPLALRQPDFFERNHPNWLGYTLRDVVRVAHFRGISFGVPHPAPIVQDVVSGKITANQPYICRITRLWACRALCSKASRILVRTALQWLSGAKNRRD